MEIQQLKYFMEVVRCGSFVRASDALFITRQTISSAIAQLEAELGYPLLIRSKNGVELTEDGQFFYMRIAEQFSAFDALKQDMLSHTSLHRLPVRIGLVPWLDYWIKDIFSSFREEHPEYRIELIECPGSEATMNLAANKLHFVFTRMPSEANPAFISEQIASFPLMLAVHKDNPLAGKKTLDPADTEGQTFLSTFWGYNQMEYKGRKWQPYDESAKFIKTDEMLHSIHLLLQNKGVMLCHARSFLLGQLSDVRMIPYAQNYVYPYFLRTSTVTAHNREYDAVCRDLGQYLKTTIGG